jgi:hypothetical protein
MKYTKRIQADFEKILVQLDPSTTYQIAFKKAEEFAKEFVSKRKLNSSEYKDILDECIDMIDDWFPEIVVYEFSAKI